MGTKAARVARAGASGIGGDGAPAGNCGLSLPKWFGPFAGRRPDPVRGPGAGFERCSSASAATADALRDGAPPSRDRREARANRRLLSWARRPIQEGSVSGASR
ncbi:hypothetical protein F8B43_4229 [Methylorubrum populi]|uniref:Uncharacterized protein n=1 Tax=Methylorubrum populi TaxID=223967 RepID=A0A833J1Q9_9HYPH|nr:hypothetical protein F8B43_4229 [Methylorubrum populi]